MDFQTPEWVCDIMVSRIVGNPRSILEPTPGEGNLVRAITDRYPEAKVLKPSHFEALEVERVDWVVANPPFSPTLVGYKMLERMFKFSGNVIVLMPWVALINSEKRTRYYLDRGLKEVIHLPRRAFLGARVQTCIMILKGGCRGEVKLTFAP